MAKILKVKTSLIMEEYVKVSELTWNPLKFKAPSKDYPDWLSTLQNNCFSSVLLKSGVKGSRIKVWPAKFWLILIPLENSEFLGHFPIRKILSVNGIVLRDQWIDLKSVFFGNKRLHLYFSFISFSFNFLKEWRTGIWKYQKVVSKSIYFGKALFQVWLQRNWHIRYMTLDLSVTRWIWKDNGYWLDHDVLHHSRYQREYMFFSLI